jgi:hypothetical protein
MTAPYVVSSSSVLPATPEVAYDAVLGAPLEQILGDRSGPIPPVRECRGQDGAWESAGQTRTIVLGDGGTVLETLLLADREGGDYRYRLSDVRGPMKLLMRSVDGQFTFVPEGSGARVTWSWTIHATNPVARLALPLFAIFWNKAAAKMFGRLGARLPA